MREQPTTVWRKQPLGELFRLYREAVNPGSYPRETFQHYSIPAFDESGGPVIEAGRRIESNKTLLSRPTILVSKLNPRKPRVMLVSDTSGLRRCASTEWMPYVAASGDVDIKFYKWLLGSRDFQGRLERVATGSTNSHVRARPSETLRWAVPVPPLPEQRRIAEILDTLDEAIRKTEQVIAKLQQMKQGLLHDLLTRGIDDNGELRDPDRHPEQFKDSPLGRIPREWEVSSVAREFDIMSGMTLGPHRRPRRNVHPYLRVANVYRDRIALDDVAFLEAKAVELVGKTLRQGDLLVVEGHANPEEIGRCAMATPAVAGFTFQNHLFRLRPHRLDPEYGLRWMNGELVRSYWHRICSTSSGLNTINRTKLGAVPVAVVSPEEQERVRSVLAGSALRLETEQAELGKLRALKHGLMDDLLTGRIRVSVPEEAAA